jgi:CRP/FNR family transcriptional regulator, cyclic AMP receptor protein
MVTEPNVHPIVLSPYQLELLHKAGTPQSYSEGDNLFREGDRSDFAVVIERGLVKLVAKVPETRKRSALTLRGRGDLIGEFACIEGSLRSATATALTAVQAYVIKSANLLPLLNGSNGILLTLYKMMIARLAESDRRRLEFGAHTAIGVVGRVLLDFAERHGEPESGSITLPVTQHDLEGLASVSKKTVSRAIQEFARHGVVSQLRGKVVIHNLDVLRNFLSQA